MKRKSPAAIGSAFVKSVAVPAVASVAARGDLLALALGSAALALFLRGRQERRPRLVPPAIALVVLAGFASPLALLYAPVAAGLEYASARRYRPRAVRWRTAATARYSSAWDQQTLRWMDDQLDRIEAFEQGLNRRPLTAL